MRLWKPELGFVKEPTHDIVPKWETNTSTKQYVSFDFTGPASAQPTTDFY